ncbi:hypothetical protein [Terribacillus saccharophilus]|uniref:hypothetical protein n=1 Tax=Terribacillus saccharophilus TaxID=361277 RepID=UPI003982C179
MKRQSKLAISTLVLLVLLAAGCSNTETAGQAKNQETEIHSKESQLKDKEAVKINEEEAEAATEELESEINQGIEI